MSRCVATAASCLVLVVAMGQAGAQKVPPSGEALLDALAMGMPSDEAAAALDALAAHPLRSGLDVLLGYSRHRGPELRARALTALAALDDRKARAAVMAGLGDQDAEVRAAAGRALAARRDRTALPPLMALLRRGDAAATAPLAALADAEVARTVAELAGQVPDGLLAQTLGGMLARPSLGPETTYVSLVRALGAIPGDDALAALAAHGERGPSRPSVKEARAILERRRGGTP